MQTRHLGYRTNAATIMFNKEIRGQAFTRYEAYLSLLALVGGLLINLLPSLQVVSKVLPNNSYGELCVFFYTISWWCQLLAILDALVTTAFAAKYKVFPNIFGVTYLFLTGVMIAWIFWLLSFIHEIIDPKGKTENPTLYEGTTRTSAIIYAVTAALAILYLPFLVVFRSSQYRRLALQGKNTI